MTGHPALLPDGFRDRLPPAAEAVATLTRTIVDGFTAYGYERVAPPLVESERSLAFWLGKPLGGALFRSPDPATGAALAIRPDITGQIARIAATRLDDAPRPLRLTYVGPVLRGRASQIDPSRERVQAGAELIGSDSIAALGEVIRAAAEALTAAGVDKISIDLTTPDLVDELAGSIWPVADTARDALFTALDSKDHAALAAAGLGQWQALLDVAGPAEAALPRLQAIAPARAQQLAGLVASLPDIRLTIDPAERQGFEYQSHIGFSLFGAVNGQPLRQEVGRGGTYRVTHPDGRQEPAAGVSVYIDTLVDAGLGRSRRPRIFLPLGTPPADAARLRTEGYATVAALSDADTPAGCSHIWTNGSITPKG